MSRLIFPAWSSNKPDDILAVFEGTPSETLAQAIEFFDGQSKAQAERIVSGHYPDAPSIIVEHSKKFLENPHKNYTVARIEGGYNISVGDGIDLYVLIE